MDHEAVLEAQTRDGPQESQGEPDARQYEAWFGGHPGWLVGDHDADYAESWGQFRDRVRSRAGGPWATGRRVVVTSGGPISAVVADLLASPAAYERIAPVVVNASLTKVVVGSRGQTLVSFNEHGHLAGDLLTYR